MSFDTFIPVTAVVSIDHGATYMEGGLQIVICLKHDEGYFICSTMIWQFFFCFPSSLHVHPKKRIYKKFDILNLARLGQPHIKKKKKKATRK